MDSAAQLKAAKSVLVLGGGAVGVELAAEIAEAYPQKQVTIVDSHTALCSTFAHPKSVSHIMKWFEARENVEMVLGHRIAQSTPWVGGSIRTYTLENGRFVCARVQIVGESIHVTYCDSRTKQCGMITCILLPCHARRLKWVLCLLEQEARRGRDI